MRRATIPGGLAVILASLAGCSDQQPVIQDMAATPYWAQPDTVFVPVITPTDAKAMSRTSMWVADPETSTVFMFAPGEHRYIALGSGDREPTQIVLPAKLAVSADLGVSVFDLETRSVDMFTPGGDYLRGFEVEFIPAVMEFTTDPVGYIFAMASSDDDGQPHVLIIQTDMLGGSRDTLLSADAGPSVLRGAVASGGEILITASGEGLWVWSKTVPDSVYEVAARSARVIPVRTEDQTAIGLLGDPANDMLWLAHAEPGLTRLSAYDMRAGVESVFLGTRTVNVEFTARTVYDGILMGWAKGRQGLLAVSFDLNTDQMVRQELAEDD